MGMSASQARLLAITSRMNDIELRSQQISNTKIRLSDESEQVANDYNKALNASKLTYTTFGNVNGQMTQQIVDLKPSNLSEYGFKLVDKDGKECTSNNITAAQMYEMIESGQFSLQQKTTVEGVTKWTDTSVSGNTALGIQTEDKDLAKAEAEYNAATAKINTKEKKLDQQIKEMDTEHNALKTEYDSVKSLISDNISKSFQLFS